LFCQIEQGAAPTGSERYYNTDCNLSAPA
jgi:hypothetical protein